MDYDRPKPAISEKHDSIFGLLLRLFWMLLGDVFLLISAIFIYQGKDWKFHTADVFFLCIAAALVLTRYLDIKFYNGLTASGEPASMANFHKYAGILLLLSAAIWILAHILNYMMVKPV
jgi:hypothetical protein